MENILLKIYEDGDVALKRIPEPSFKEGLYFSLDDVGIFNLYNELVNYGCLEEEASQAMDAALKGPLYEEFIVGKV